MKVGDFVQYYFPIPLKKDKVTVRGIISFVSETAISIDCIDNTKLKVTAKNFANIKKISSIKKTVELKNDYSDI